MPGLDLPTIRNHLRIAASMTSCWMRMRFGPAWLTLVWVAAPGKHALLRAEATPSALGGVCVEVLWRATAPPQSSQHLHSTPSDRPEQGQPTGRATVKRGKLVAEPVLLAIAASVSLGVMEALRKLARSVTCAASSSAVAFSPGGAAGALALPTISLAHAVDPVPQHHPLPPLLPAAVT